MEQKTLFAFFGVLLMFSPLAGGKENTAVENAPASSKCQSTYYIHEYHVHGTEDGDAKGAGDVIARDSTGKPLIAREDLLQERVKWEREIEELQAQLAEERIMRLNQMSHFTNWTRRMVRWEASASVDVNETTLAIHIELLDKVANNLSGMMESEKELLKRKDSNSHPKIIVRDPPKLVTVPPPGAAESRARTRYAQVPLNKSKEKSLLEENGVEKGDADRETENNLRNEAVEDLKKEVMLMKQTLNTVAGEYLYVYKTSRKTHLQQRRLEQSHRKYQERLGRLQKYHRSRIQQMNWKLGNETELWHKGITDLQLRLQCLEDTCKLCPNGKEAQPVKIPERVTSKPENMAESIRHSQNDTPMTQHDSNKEEGVQIGKAGGERKDGGSHTQVAAPSRGHVTPEMMVEAGVRVSQWYMDQAVAQRPKDCSDIDYWVQRTEPVQTIYLRNKTMPVRVLCDEGWTVIQHNTNTADHGADRTWEDYKIGFGKLSLEEDTFWIGNEYLSLLTQENQRDYQLLIDMHRQSDYSRLQAKCEYFQVGSANSWYKLSVGDCIEPDILGRSSTTDLNNRPFSTPDKAMDDRYRVNADAYRVGWWYSSTRSEVVYGGVPDPCFTNLNTPSPWYCDDDGVAVMLVSVTMKIKPS